MKNICIGDKFQIQCYKHNGKIHRSWDEAIVLDIKKDYIVFGNNKTEVIEAHGTFWKTKEPAVMYFFKDKWFNIISQIKKDGVYYYCNIASPFILEQKTIKYIDYDLDLRIFSNGDFKVLDKLEYAYHRKIMKYGDDLNKVINLSLDELIKFYKKKVIMFNNQKNKEYIKNYFELKKQEKNSKFF